MAILAGSKPPDWIPSLAGRIDPQVEQAIDFLFRAVYAIRDGQGISTEGLKSITQVVLPGITSSVVKDFGPGGSNPIPGVGGNPVPSPTTPGTTPQPASLTPVTALPGPNDPLSVVGSTVIFEGVQWTYTLLPGVQAAPFWFRSASLGTTLQGTHADRLATFPATSYPIGTNFYETDTTITYQVQDISGLVWLYLNGVQRDVLANIPAGLGPDDFGYWFKATDFLHDYNWDGSAWHFATADPGSDFYTTTLNLAGPNGGLWGKADGSTYTVAQDDGTTSPVTTSVTANTWLRR